MKNDWEKKAKCSAYLSSKIFATSAWVWTRSTSFCSFQRSNWSPTYILYCFHLEDTALLFLFLSESVKVRFFPRADTFSNHMLFIVSKQCAFSRRVLIEGHMNRVKLNWMLIILHNYSDNDSFGSFLSKKEHKSYILQHNCLISFTTIFLGMKKNTILVDNMPLKPNQILTSSVFLPLNLFDLWTLYPSPIIYCEIELSRIE